EQLAVDRERAIHLEADAVGIAAGISRRPEIPPLPAIHDPGNRAPETGRRIADARATKRPRLVAPEGARTKDEPVQRRAERQQRGRGHRRSVVPRDRDVVATHHAVPLAATAAQPLSENAGKSQRRLGRGAEPHRVDRASRQSYRPADRTGSEEHAEARGAVTARSEERR